MPSLIRLLMVVGLLGGVAYGAMFALANFVQPKQREMSITIPAQQPHQAELNPSPRSGAGGRATARPVGTMAGGDSSNRLEC